MEKIIIQQDGIGKRVDRFLAEEFFLYTRGEVIRRIKDGKVEINGKMTKPSHILEEGDEIALEDFSHEKKEKTLFANNEIPLESVFENKDIVVINKQAGIQVHPSFNEDRDTLVNALIAKYPEIANVHDSSEGAQLRPGIVHRLDKDTSGVMVVARNQKAFEALKEAFKSREIEKTYITIVQGAFKEKTGEIDKSIARSTTYRKQVIARKNTHTIVRSALTEYKVIGEYENFSLVEARPKTGRMHQIRIHLASVGHPVVGDLLYGNPKSAEILEKKVTRQLLHAQKLKLVLFGEQLEFSAPMPKDFEEFLAEIAK